MTIHEMSKDEFNSKEAAYLIALQLEADSPHKAPGLEFCPEVLESLEDTEALMIKMLEAVCDEYGIRETLDSAAKLHVFKYVRGNGGLDHSVFWDYKWRKKREPVFPKLCVMIDRLGDELTASRKRKKKNKKMTIKGNFNSIQDVLCGLVNEISTDGTATGMKDGTYSFNVQFK